MISIRPMTAGDVPHIVDYFCRNTSEFYDRMGVDVSKVPTPEKYAEQLNALVDAKNATAFYSVWLLNGEPIGHSSLKDIVYGESGSQHLHMWKELERGKGYGAKLFCLSAVDFYERFDLKNIICEPRASNPLPNRMLQKIGFKFLGSRVAASSEISVVCELNRYSIEREVAEKFLSAAV